MSDRSPRLSDEDPGQDDDPGHFAALADHPLYDPAGRGDIDKDPHYDPTTHGAAETAAALDREAASGRLHGEDGNDPGGPRGERAAEGLSDNLAAYRDHPGADEDRYLDADLAGTLHGEDTRAAALAGRIAAASTALKSVLAPHPMRGPQERRLASAIDGLVALAGSRPELVPGLERLAADPPQIRRGAFLKDVEQLLALDPGHARTSTAREPAAVSQTGRIAENLELHGARPLPGEPDPRDVWFHGRDGAGLEEEVPAHVQAGFDEIGASIDNLLDAVTPRGFQMGDHRESFLWGIVNTFQHQVAALEDRIKKLTHDVEEHRRTQSRRAGETSLEDASAELEAKIDELEAAAEKRDTFERMRDYTADMYFHHTAKVWAPRKGAHLSETGDIASTVPGRDYLRALREHRPLPDLQEGTLVAVTAPNVRPDHVMIVARLNDELQRHPDMILAHGGGRGIPAVAARWARDNNVRQIVFEPDFRSHEKRGTAIRLRDEDMAKCRPETVICFTSPGARLPRLHDAATERGIHVDIVPQHRVSKHLPERAERPAPAPAEARSPNAPEPPTAAEKIAAKHAAAHAREDRLNPLPDDLRIEGPVELTTPRGTAGVLVAENHRGPVSIPAPAAAHPPAATVPQHDPSAVAAQAPPPHITPAQALDVLVDAALQPDNRLSEDAARYHDGDRHPLRRVLLSRVIGAIHSVAEGPEGASDRLSAAAIKTRELDRQSIYSEIDNAQQHENAERGRYASDSVDTLHTLHAELTAHFRESTGERYAPAPPDPSRNGRTVTAATAEALNLVDRIQHARNLARLPEGEPIAVTALKEGADRQTVFAAMDKVLAKRPDIWLVHGNNDGVLRDVSDWARLNKVKQVHVELDRNDTSKERVLKRDLRILDVKPVGLIEFRSPSGKTTKLADEVRNRTRIPIYSVPPAKTEQQDRDRTRNDAQHRSAAENRAQGRGQGRGVGMSM